MINFFRLVSVLEGMSYIAILSVTLGIISREFVSIIGMTHGILFMLYVMLSLRVSDQQKWSISRWSLLFIASFVPFAFIAVERYLKRILDAADTDASPSQAI